MKRIKRLANLLINQIAAGEVIERPASVVKELLENSIDSGATQISIEIEGGGSQLIRIRDNGSGIDKDDLLLAISNHATSKINSFDDLSAIHSLGFRGEALASVSSVSRFLIQSKPAEQENAWQVQLDGKSTEPTVEPSAHPNGTTVEVRDLFFNTPVRRKFLRALKTEFIHIEELVKRIALSHYPIGFELHHDGKRIFQLPAAEDSEQHLLRLKKLFGRAFMAHAIPIDEKTEGIKLYGWIASPEFARSQQDLQYFYINQRMVKDKLIGHALRQAYENHLYQGRQASYVLYLEIDADKVDVNVHPAKREVRFHEARMVHDFIFRRISKILDENAAGEDSSQIHSADSAPLQVREGIPHYSFTPQATKNFQHAKDAVSDAHQKPLGRAIAQLFNRYLLAENAQGLLLMDCSVAKLALYQRQMQAELEQKDLTVRPLLVPITIDKPPYCRPAHLTKLAEFGFNLDELGMDQLIVRTMPCVLEDIELSVFLTKLLIQCAKSPKLTLAMLFAIIAKYPQLMPKQKFFLDDMNQFLRRCENANVAQSDGSGRLLWRQVSLDDFHALLNTKMRVKV